ncbi:MAG: hypothetical protein QUS35_04765 [bacterium]|nr:hypothetical protein [bacterium]
MSSSIREDYLLRMIEKTAKAVAQMIGFRKSGDFTAARAVLDAAYASLLGPDALLFSRMDPETGARLLGEPEKMAVMADLIHEDAELRRAAQEGGAPDLDRKALAYARLAAEARPEEAEYTRLVERMKSHI